MVTRRYNKSHSLHAWRNVLIEINFKCCLMCVFLVVGLNLVGWTRDGSYIPASYSAMECDPSPSRHPHRSRYQTTTVGAPPPPSLLNHGPSSLPYAPYPNTMMDNQTPKHNQAANGPQSKQTDSSKEDSSPMVGVCIQQSPVAIH